MLNRMKIGPKLIGGFVIVASILAGLTIYSYTVLQDLRKMQDDGAELSDNALDADHMRRMPYKFYQVIADAEINRNLKETKKAWDEVAAEYEQLHEMLHKQADTDEEKKWLDENGDGIDKLMSLYNDEMVPLLSQPRSPQTDEKIRALDAQIDETLEAAQVPLRKFAESLKKESVEGDEAFDKDIQSAGTISLVLAVAGTSIALILGIFLTISITRPLTQGVTMMQEMAKGHLSRRLKMNRQDEIGQLASAMDEFAEDLQKNVVATVIKIGEGDVSTDLKAKDGQDEIIPAIMKTTESLRGLMAEAAMLRKAAVDGKLATRGQADKFKGGYREIVQGVNDTLDAVIGPLNVAAEYVDRISKGDIPPKITDSYNGDFNEIKNNLNRCIESLSGLINDMRHMADEHNKGDIDVVVPVDKFEGAYKVMAQGLNDMVNGHIAVKKKAMACVKEFGQGNFDAPLEKFPGKKAFINDTIEQVRANLKALIGDANLLSKAAVEGKLATRADASKHQGDFRKIVQGVNDTLDAVIGPLNVAAEYVDRISKGDIPPKITDNYNGDFNEIKNNLNRCIESLNGLINDMRHMSDEHNKGDIDVVMPVEKFEGAYKVMAQGLNDMVNGHIAVKKKAMACIAEFGKGNLEAVLEKFPGKKAFINENIERLRANLKEFIAQMRHMSDQHNAGDIDVAIPADKFEGAYKVMSQGVNEMVFGHIAVKKKAMACIAEFGKGNFDAPLEKFPGKKVFINDTIEGLRLNLKNVSAEVGTLIEASKRGALSTRGAADKYAGDWQKLVSGVNEMLDAIIQPVNEAAAILERVAARDLTARVKGDYQGDHAKIKNALNSATDNLDKALTQVAEATEQVSSGSQQISAGSQSLAQGANEQASSLEEVSSSLEEMSSMTKQNAENANQAKGLAGEANNHAATGAEAMGRMSDAINRIKESSDQTAKIVKTIDEIAMQTNLLALNAAVEAARAGEAGRGFAVVAEEVRNLAQRSAEAAKNTANMIEESVKNADGGVKIAVEVSKSFDSIAGSAKKVNDLIAEIAAASQEQSQGIDQVNNAVAQMDKVTQQNAANSEESASAAEEMSSQAEELQSMIGQFALTQAVQQKKSAAPVHQAARLAAPAASLNVKHGNGGGKHAVKQAANPRAELAMAGKSARPEDVIPMDDAGLKEF